MILMILTASLGYTHEITVTDLYGRKVITPEKVTSIAALGPGALRIVTYSGAQDMVIGRELFEDKLSKSLRPYTYALPEKYKKLPAVSAGGPGKMPDIEKLIMAKPDVIFTVAFTPEQMDTISRKTRIPVVGLNYGATGHTNLHKVKESIRLVGYITHNEERAQKVLNKIALLRKDIMERAEGQSPKSVFMASIAYKGSREFTSTEKDHPACAMLGVKNIADTVGSSGTHVTMQMESILKMQPDYIFYDITGLNALKKKYESVYKTLQLLNAVAKKEVYTVLPYNWYNSNVENIFLTAYFMGKVIYPDKFADVDVEHLAGEIYNDFLHMNPYSDIIKKNPAYRRLVFEKDGIHFGE